MNGECSILINELVHHHYSVLGCLEVMKEFSQTEFKTSHRILDLEIVQYFRMQNPNGPNILSLEYNLSTSLGEVHANAVINLQLVIILMFPSNLGHDQVQEPLNDFKPRMSIQEHSTDLPFIPGSIRMLSI